MQVDTVVSFALGKLGDLLTEEANFLKGVKGKVDELQRQLRLMQCFLEDAHAKRDESKMVCNHVAEIRQLVYVTEMAIETFSLKVASRRRGGFKNKLKRYACFLIECKALHEVGLEIDAIRKKLNEVTSSSQTYGGGNTGKGESSEAANERQRWLRQTYPHVVEEDFVGMDEVIKELVSLVTREDKSYPIVSIWGMGGQGKTTLAKKIYNHHDVRRCFQGFAWACITQQCQIRNTLQDILKQLLPDQGGINNMEDRELVEKLHKIQEEKKCLVVVDDLWSVEDWRVLKPAFPNEGVGSKILLTTRKRNVAEVGFVHKLRSLSTEEGWELLQRKAFSLRDNPESTISKEMEALGRDMVGQCGGLPLAISVIGGILRGKDWSYWEKMGKDITSLAGKGESVEEEPVPVKQVLELSYNDLPYRLKPCFLYLGHFPEDSEIVTECLYAMWLAEGMISLNDQRQGETMIEVAERYLSELTQRSMVQVQANLEPRIGARYETCRLHDVMRELLLSKAKEEDFLEVIDLRNGNRQVPISSSSSTCETPRLAIYSDEKQNDFVPPQLEITPYLCSFFFVNTSRFLDTIRFLDTSRFLYTSRWPKEMFDLKHFKFLRVLSIEGFDLARESRLLKGIGKLIHLRYLSIRRCELRKLPSSIGNLRYLQTLDLRVTEVVSMCNVIWKMERLKHLYLPDNICERRQDGAKLRLVGLSELEEVENFDASAFDVKHLHKLTHLRHLREVQIRNLDDLVRMVHYLQDATSNQLRYLSVQIRECNFSSEEENNPLLNRLLGFHALHSLYIWGQIGKLPHHDHFSRNLTRLYFSESHLNQDPMATLEKLPNLRTLSLNDDAFLGLEMVCSTKGFPQLKVLWLVKLNSLRNWRVDEGAMPNLSLLAIAACSKLEMIPDGLKFITALQAVEIAEMPEEFNNRVRVVDGVEGEDFHKIRHVPTIDFNLFKIFS